ncbi:MAG TPA: SAM-dependent methyltransferase [Clostridiales bacterium]|nr:class I SAM-dependent methyltransferase [Clostridia bacterium]MDD4679788.1 class I SAM-dependent methyltransferase [Clostridia bacterium]HCS73832.1 SAM-dependent methyltransferase [Clostridiales bacterium]
MNLKPRLHAIADLVPFSRKMADIGTDHGYLPLFLVQHGRVTSAIASDVSAGSLKKASILIDQYNMNHAIETRLGNGLSILSPGEAETIIIAGMGAVLISEILQKGEKVARNATTLILQPMIGQEELRRWLIQNQYRIKDEELVKESNRIYEIIAAVPDTEVKAYENDIYYEIAWSWIIKKHPLLKEWLVKKIRVLKEIVINLEKGQTHSAAIQRLEAKEKLRQYEEVYHCHIR